jgi:hypothetical protein
MRSKGHHKGISEGLYPIDRPRHLSYSPTARTDNLNIMTLLPPKDNFADLRESADKLLKPATDGDLNRLVDLVGKLAYRCDLLEREVERQGRAEHA